MEAVELGFPLALGVGAGEVWLDTLVPNVGDRGDDGDAIRQRGGRFGVR